jgi:ABC-type sugar transport system ATPase subunit
MSFAPAGRLGVDVGAPAGTIVGVRPEHARPWVDGDGLLGPLDGQVEYVEALGRETFLGVRHDEETQLVLCVEGRSPAQPGDRVRYGLVRDGLRFFDPESGRARAR